MATVTYEPVDYGASMGPYTTYFYQNSGVDVTDTPTAVTGLDKKESYSGQEATMPAFTLANLRSVEVYTPGSTADDDITTGIQKSVFLAADADYPSPLADGTVYLQVNGTDLKISAKEAIDNCIVVAITS